MRRRFTLALLVLLGVALLLVALHPRSLLAAKPLANRLHEHRRPNPSRRLLTAQSQARSVAVEAKRVPSLPRADLLRDPRPAPQVPDQARAALTRPVYLRPPLDPRLPGAPPS